jgi:hypothetical protein
MRHPRAEVIGMPTFRRIKIQATVETESMLVQEDQIEGVLGALRDKLQHLDLDVLSVGPTEPAPTSPTSPAEAADDDPWSVGGRSVE